MECPWSASPSLRRGPPAGSTARCGNAVGNPKAAHPLTGIQAD